jgi:CNT family concentrative nucleoside transporter
MSSTAGKKYNQFFMKRINRLILVSGIISMIILPLIIAQPDVPVQDTTAQTVDARVPVAVVSSDQAPDADTSRELSNIIPGQGGFSFSLIRLLRGMLGMLVLIGIAWIFSVDRKAIAWKYVGIGLAIQLLLAIGILYVPFIQTVFEIVGKVFVKVLQFTQEGVRFLFGSGEKGDVALALQNFAITILPTIVFFSAITSVLFYLGIIQLIVRGLGFLLSRALGLSGAESLSVAGNIFLGQTESPLMIKAYLEKMNDSEIMLVMSGGMATLAGGVLAAYIGFLGGNDPQQQLIFAKHLLTASVMAAPGVVVISKILVPQTAEIDKKIEISQSNIGKNILDAISNGTTEGLRLAVNVAAMLLVFISFIAFINYIFVKVGDWTTLNNWVSGITRGQYDELSLEFILGYSLSPLMWLIGVPASDITLVGSLLGKKLIMTEFIGYVSLSEMKSVGMFSDPKSIIMSVYMLCGFANFASIGIQIGGIGALAPGKRILLSRFGMRALLAGTLASLLSATIVGILLG